MKANKIFFFKNAQDSCLNNGISMIPIITVIIINIVIVKDNVIITA